MPVICPSCHKMVAEQERCANCGEPLAIARPGEEAGLGGAVMRALLGEVFKFVFAILAVGALCIAGIWLFLS